MIEEFFPHIIPATIEDYPIIQNMARFYVYNLSRDCGFISEDWVLPADGLYESFDFKPYFQDPTRKAYLIKVKDELAGFVLLNCATTSPDTEWNMGEFFILAKFQRKGIGKKVANRIWEIHPGLWEVSILPENKRALAFWRKIISDLTDGKYSEEMKDVDFDVHRPKRCILSFDTKGYPLLNPYEGRDETWMMRESLKQSVENKCVSTKTAPHFLWGECCDGWWLKKGGSFTVIEEMMPKGTSEIRHFHHRTEQFFYILEGALILELDGVEHPLKEGDSIVVSPCVLHRVFNKSPQSVRFLVVSCPDSREDRIDLEE